MDISFEEKVLESFKVKSVILVDPGEDSKNIVSTKITDGPHETPVYWRDYLPINMEIDGPAIIEQMDCTTLVEPGDKARGDADGNIIIGVGGL